MRQAFSKYALFAGKINPRVSSTGYQGQREADGTQEDPDNLSKKARGMTRCKEKFRRKKYGHRRLRKLRKIAKDHRLGDRRLWSSSAWKGLPHEVDRMEREGKPTEKESTIRQSLLAFEND